MNTIKIIMIATVACLSLSANATLYRWIDNTGKVHYSGSVPASDAQLGHTQYNKNGMQQKVVASAKKQKALKEIELARIKQNKLNAKDKKNKELRDLEDSRLLTVFSTEKELVKAYEAKFRLAQLTIDLLKNRHKKQSKKLEKLENDHERMKDLKYKQTISTEIDGVLDNLKIYQQAITENHIEKDKIHKEFDETLDRYKKLAALKNTKY